MSSRNSIILITGAGAAMVPMLLIAILPFVRVPAKRGSKVPEIPSSVTREATPQGLEILRNDPSPEVGLPPVAPLILVHGGFGSALCYTEWLPYFANRGRIAYAVSLSGHGLSPRPSNFVGMNVSDFSRELESVVNYVHTLYPHSPRPVLIGHSAGGGLIQYTAANTKEESLVSGLILVAAFPPTGGWKVYLNWFRIDPFMWLRMIWSGGDAKAALSSPTLVKRAFFGPKMTDSSLQTFYNGMNPEESVGWPISMMFSFVDPKKAKKHVNGRIAWIGGENDVLMSPSVLNDAANAYGTTVTFIPQAGHHLLRDATWKDGADAVLAQLQKWSL